MCGIYFSILLSPSLIQSLKQAFNLTETQTDRFIIDEIKKRGPTGQKSLAFSFESTWEIEIEEMSKLNDDEEGVIYSSVLHLRGETPTE